MNSPRFRRSTFAFALLLLAATSLSGCGKAADESASNEGALSLNSGDNGGNGDGNVTQTCDIRIQNLTTGYSKYASQVLPTEVIAFRVGDNVRFEVMSTPGGASYWNGTKNGALDADYLDAGQAPFALSYAVPAYSVGNYTRSISVRDDRGNETCTTQTVRISITNSGTTGAALTTDKTLYRIGETPRFQIAGAPSSTSILWSSTKNGASTAEVDIDYGQVTDGSGALTVYGSTWASMHVGTWTKTARIGTTTLTAQFTVIP